MGVWLFFKYLTQHLHALGISWHSRGEQDHPQHINDLVLVDAQFLHAAHHLLLGGPLIGCGGGYAYGD